MDRVIRSLNVLTSYYSDYHIYLADSVLLQTVPPPVGDKIRSAASTFNNYYIYEVCNFTEFKKPHHAFFIISSGTRH